MTVGRKRESHKYLPKYVYAHHGALWYRPPHGEAVRICDEGDDATMYRFMADKVAPVSGSLLTLGDCFDRYEREVLPTLEPRTQKDYRRHLVVLRKVFGKVRPDDVRPRDVGRFLDVDKGKVQRNRMVAVLSAVYTKAVGRWYVADRNPCAGVERNRTQPRDRNVSDAEFAEFYKLATPRIRIAMDLALLTGQRQGDLRRLKWESVSPEGVLFQPAKTRRKVGKRLLIEMSPALEEVLARARALLPNLPREYVLRTRSGQPYTENGFRACWQRLMRKYVKAGGARFTFHDLRAKSGTDSATLQAAYERLGHTSISMTRRVYDRGVRKVTPLR